METTNKIGRVKRILIITLCIIMFALPLAGCSDNDGTVKVKLDPSNPVTIKVWNYYTGALLDAFRAMIKEFNETKGMEVGIIVEENSFANVSELEKQVRASAKEETGSQPMPNIFASYADTAYEAERMGVLANLDDYISKKDQANYIASYVEEGRIGQNGELRIFPVAKATEVFMINDTDWQKFAAQNPVTYGDLATIEGLTRVAKLYYEWTDALTPGTPNDGKAFYARDAIANLFIIASKELGTEIFEVSGGTAKINIEENIMKKIWDNYYVPYISGYFLRSGNFGSDDVKLGKVLSFVGSTASVNYFPKQVVPPAGEQYNITAKILPAPKFAGAGNVMVQQGAGMVVTKSTLKEEYASVVFLKWFTEVDNNAVFSARSGYMPVKKEANNYDVFVSKAEAAGISFSSYAKDTLKVAFDGIASGELYTSKAFSGGVDARKILDEHLHKKAIADRAKIIELLNSGRTLADAVAQYNTYALFQTWLASFKAELAAVTQ